MRPYLSASLLLSLIYVQSLFNQVKAQDIQWGSRGKTMDRTAFFATDSVNVFNNIYNARQFLYDSLGRVAAESGAQFHERVYTYNFQPVSKIRQLVISFPDAGRYIYYIKAFDTGGNEHVVYEYSTRGHCADAYDWLIITVPPIAYTITALEVGTFQKIKTLDKLGLSQQENVNDVVSQLIGSNLAESYCSLTSFMADKELLPSGAVNSEKSEVKPIISADGNRLYFHRQNFKENIGGVKDEQDIYVAENAANRWDEATNLGAPINNKSSNGIASVMPGENGAYLINEYKNNKIDGQGVSFSRKELKGWSIPEKVIIDDFYNNSPYFDFCISVSMGEMILAIDRTDGWGDQDLYVSRYDDESDKWSVPENLGEVVNTPLAEVSPYLAADGKTLYFASEGHLGYGGFDLFITKRLDNSWTRWSQPENLGPIINSDGHDLYYSVSALADYAYFSSGTDSNRDIFRIALPKVYKPAPVTIIQGHIIKSDSSAVSATIKVLNTKGSLLTSARSSEISGFYRAIIPVDSSCIIQFFKQAQLLQTDTLFTFGYSGKKIITKNFVVNTDALGRLSDKPTEELSDAPPSSTYDPSAEFSKVINGKVVDGATLRPVGTRLLYYREGSVISRALSNPQTGDYQVVLTGEMPDSIKTLSVATGTLRTLQVHPSFDNHLLIKLPHGKSDTVRLGTNIYMGMSEEEIKKVNHSFSKRRIVKRYFYGMIKTKVLHPALQNDLKYAIYLLEKYRNGKLSIFISCESDSKKADRYKNAAFKCVQKTLQESGLSEARVNVIQAAPFVDLNDTKNRINTGIWLQLLDEY